MRITVLAGGVGAARFLDGLCRVVDPAEITVVCNVGDDFQWRGLHVSPDIDTVIYTLAGLEGEQGWGHRGDTFAMLDELEALGEEPWFRIGDRDLATHVWRSERLRGGETLSAVTAELARRRGLRCRLLPVTDDPHPTVVATPEGELAFQDYFVRGRASATVTGLRFPGAAEARPAPDVIEAITEADAVIVAPSNPFVSIDPLLAVPGVREALEASRGDAHRGQPDRRRGRGEGPRRRDDAQPRPRGLGARSGAALRRAAGRVRPRCGRRRARRRRRGAGAAGRRLRHDDDQRGAARGAGAARRRGGDIVSAGPGALCVIVPVKGLGEAKSRLASVLGPAQRASLVLAMLEDVLIAVRAAHDGPLLLVTPDEGCAPAAERAGAELLADAGGGYNAAVAQALAAAGAREAGAALVLPADQPRAQTRGAAHRHRGARGARGRRRAIARRRHGAAGAAPAGRDRPGLRHRIRRPPPRARRGGGARGRLARTALAPGRRGRGGRPATRWRAAGRGDGGVRLGTRLDPRDGCRERIAILGPRGAIL